MSIMATGLRYSIAIDTRTSDAAGRVESLGVVCLWTAAGLILTVLAFALGLGSDAGQFLTMAG
jgi:hypothetical protein